MRTRCPSETRVLCRFVAKRSVLQDSQATESSQTSYGTCVIRQQLMLGETPSVRLLLQSAYLDNVGGLRRRIASLEDTVIHHSHQKLIDEQVKGASRFVHTAVQPLSVKKERLYITNTDAPGQAVADSYLLLIDHLTCSC